MVVDLFDCRTDIDIKVDLDTGNIQLNLAYHFKLSLDIIK